VLPFGLSESLSAYGRMMKELLTGTKHTDNFVDDILCYNSSIKDHLKTMEELFKRLSAANVKIRPTKVKLGYPNVEYVGMVVGDGQLKPTDESISKVLNAQKPTTKKRYQKSCWLYKLA
jgi:Reverse transcriptase (RNA-dependent DNA polymerase)